MSTVKVKGISHLFNHSLKLKGMVLILIALLTKLVTTGIYWIINCFKDFTALAKWQPLCGCATCDTCILN